MLENRSSLSFSSCFAQIASPEAAAQARRLCQPRQEYLLPTPIRCIVPLPLLSTAAEAQTMPQDNGPSAAGRGDDGFLIHDRRYDTQEIRTL